MGEEVGGPGWGERAPEGPLAFKAWWLLLINLVVTSKSLILPKGWAAPAGKLRTWGRAKEEVSSKVKEGHKKEREEQQ